MTRKFSALFFILFLFLGSLMAWHGFLLSWNKVPTQKWDMYLDGRASVAFERVFNKELKTYHPSLTAWSLLNMALFKEGNKGVIVGKDGWLFTEEEFLLSSNDEKNFNDKISYILQVQQALQKSGILLLIVPIPAKARLYQDHLDRYLYPHYKIPVYENFVQRLKDHGIGVCSLLSPMQAEAAKNEFLFFHRDTHWTPFGAALAAETIGDCLKKNNLKTTVKEQDGYNIATSSEYLAHSGDLLRYVPVGPYADHFNLTDESYAPVRLETPDGQLDETSLFGGSAPEITLVGTSYSADTRWGFNDYLQYYIKAPVLNAADKGRGPFETMKSYLENDSFKNTPPKLIIWEIPERYLTMSSSALQKERQK